MSSGTYFMGSTIVIHDTARAHQALEQAGITPEELDPTLGVIPSALESLGMSWSRIGQGPGVALQGPTEDGEINSWTYTELLRLLVALAAYISPTSPEVTAAIEWADDTTQWRWAVINNEIRAQKGRVVYT